MIENDYIGQFEQELEIAEVAVRRLAAENTRLRALLQQAVDFAADYKLYRDWVWKSKNMLSMYD